jgi:hypothetical protein
MNASKTNEIRELTTAELDEVTGAFLGKLIRKVGRAAGTVVRPQSASSGWGTDEAAGETA